MFLQASVMVEYTYKEALELLERNLAAALEKKVSICLEAKSCITSELRPAELVNILSFSWYAHAVLLLVTW